MRWHAAVLVLASVVAPAALAQDAVAADPKHYKLEFENAQVRIIRGSLGPREKSAVIAFPPHVFVILTDSSVRLIQSNGSIVGRVPAKKGEVKWSDGGVYAVENLLDRPSEIVVVQPKSTARASRADLPPLDKHYKIEFENETVRVSRGIFAAHDKTEMFLFAPHAWVALTKSVRRLSQSDGTAKEDVTEFGAALWSAGGMVTVENLNDSLRETIVVEPR